MDENVWERINVRDVENVFLFSFISVIKLYKTTWFKKFIQYQLYQKNIINSQKRNIQAVKHLADFDLIL